jgi:serine/threonine protein kinase
VKAERNVLAEVHNPFIVKLFYSFQVGFRVFVRVRLDATRAVWQCDGVTSWWRGAQWCAAAGAGRELAVCQGPRCGGLALDATPSCAGCCRCCCCCCCCCCSHWLCRTRQQDEEFLYLVMEYLPGGDVMVSE